MLQKWLTWLSSRMLHGRFLFASPPCIPDLLMAKDFKASVLHVSDLSICFAMDSKELSSILDCFCDKKAIKTPKLNTIWLELIARVLNMPIGLKGDNYYSKVFKRVTYKLSNSTFWVVIRWYEEWWTYYICEWVIVWWLVLEIITATTTTTTIIIIIIIIIWYSKS